LSWQHRIFFFFEASGWNVMRDKIARKQLGARGIYGNALSRNVSPNRRLTHIVMEHIEIEKSQNGKLLK
jgi:hypothetical protein